MPNQAQDLTVLVLEPMSLSFNEAGTISTWRNRTTVSSATLAKRCVIVGTNELATWQAFEIFS